MAEIFPTQQTNVMELEFSTPPLRLPDAESTAEFVLTKMLKFCAQKTGVDDVSAVIDHLQQNDNTACQYCRYGMAKQVGESLGALDENIKAVYTLDYDATPEDLCFGETPQTLLVHMIIWAKRKTGALDSLVAALDRALAQKYGDLIGNHQLVHLLDVQVVDDADVQNRTGYGASLSSLHHRPIQVWER
ncbi:MAG: hypothetical protein SWK90_19845 [Chloroflexota bacterium]|nr:hypothetical protein [Chloroflexota bacterium]